MRRRLIAATIAMAVAAGVAAPTAAGDLAYRPIRRLAVASDGGGFGSALAVLGDRLLVGAPNLGAAGTTAHAYLFDPARGALLRDFAVEVDADRWWQFSVGAVGTDAMLGIAPGDEADGLGGSVTVFDGASGAVRKTFCCLGAVTIGVGDDVMIGGAGGGGLFDPASGTLVRSLTIPDPNRRGVLAMALIGRRTLALAAAEPVGVHLFDLPTGRQIGFVGTRHGDARRFGSALAVNGATLAVTEVPQVNLFDIGFGIYLGTIDPPPGLGGAAFGTSLAYAGGYLVVGAPAGGDAGAVHLFDAAGNRAATLPADGAGSGFGRAVAGLGRNVAVGAPTADGGTVVIYAPCGDGVVDAPVEQCDDGNAVDDDACDRDCRLVAADGDTCGDADGDGTIGVSDGVQTLRAAAELGNLCTLARCDVDGDGAIGVSDGVQVLRAAAGLGLSGDCQ